MRIRFAVAPATTPVGLAGTIELARALEASGFDGVWLSDLPAGAVLDPVIGLAAIAAHTSRLRLGANIVPLGRNPFLLAKALAQLDVLSAGRLLLNFVVGLDQPGEREALGLDAGARGAVLERILASVRGWWGAEGPLAAATRPVQAPLEVWLGGHGPQALERAGRISDGWLGAARTPPEARDARLRIAEVAVRAGRSIDEEHYGLSIPYARERPDPRLLERLRASRPDRDPLELLPVGAPALRALIEAHIEAGVSKFVLRPSGPVASWGRELDWLAAAVLELQS
jgi:probable F420-dependent oxidoreductase